MSIHLYIGVSACVKGLGITSLKQYDIVNRLRDACTDGTVSARQGIHYYYIPYC